MLEIGACADALPFLQKEVHIVSSSDLGKDFAVYQKMLVQILISEVNVDWVHRCIRGLISVHFHRAGFAQHDANRPPS